MTTLSLVIPCYNESKNLPLLIERCAESINRSDVEVILVDNGSTDDSPEVMKKNMLPYSFMRSVRVEKNVGYGHGILAGLNIAKGKYLAWTHADLQTDPADVLKGLEIIENSVEPKELFIKGRRYGRLLSDSIFTMGMSIFETIILRKPLFDINAQPTLFSRDFFYSLEDPPLDFSLDLYIYYMAHKAKLKIKRFPVYFGERVHGISHWNINWKAKVKFIKRTIDYSFHLYSRLKKKK